MSFLREYKGKYLSCIASTLRFLINFGLMFWRWCEVWDFIRLHVAVELSPHHLLIKDCLFLIGESWHLVENQLTICVWTFWIFNSISLIYPHVSATLLWLALLCSKLSNQKFEVRYMILSFKIVLDVLGFLTILYAFLESICLFLQWSKLCFW